MRESESRREHAVTHCQNNSLQTGHYPVPLRTSRFLAPLACRIAALRRAGARVRAIAGMVAASPSGVQGVLGRIGYAGRRWPQASRPVALSVQAREAIALLTHRRAPRLSWREREALAGRVRGESGERIAASLGISPAGDRALVASARRRIAGRKV